MKAEVLDPADPSFSNDTQIVRFWDLVAQNQHNQTRTPTGPLAVSERLTMVCSISWISVESEQRAMSKSSLELLPQKTVPEIPIMMEQEPGSAGKNLIDQYAR